MSEPIGPGAPRLPARARIELWCAFLEDVDAEGLWPQYPALLTESERSRQRRFRFAEDRRRDLAARALVRTVLSRYAPTAPAAWVFGADALGRPRILAPRPVPPLEFNIAHSAGLVVAAVAAGGALGVDVEHLGRQTDPTRLERYFAPPEVAQLRTLPQPQRRRRFLELWTLKESYLKARGVGLRLPLSAFAFEFPAPGALRLSLEAPIADRAPRWAFAQFVLRDAYLLAVCAEHASGQRLQLVVHEAVPLGSQRRLAPRLVRAAGIDALSPADRSRSTA